MEHHDTGLEHEAESVRIYIYFFVVVFFLTQYYLLNILFSFFISRFQDTGC